MHTPDPPQRLPDPSAGLTTDPFRLDRRAVRAAFDRASGGYDAAAVLQAQVRAELLSRLELVNLTPKVVLDLGAGTGEGARALKQRYRRATVIALDAAFGMLRQARARSSWFHRFKRVCADALALPLKAGCADLILSNLMLQWCDDLDAALMQVRRALAPGGFFTFSTFGPGTLKELRTAWAAADGGSHVSGFHDMHDIGSALTRAGFAEPVLDVERHTLTYPDVKAISRDLKAVGAHNGTSERSRGLMGKDRWHRMAEAYEACRSQGVLPVSYEVVYGAAWGAAGRAAVPLRQGEARVPLHAIGRRGERR